MAEFIKYNHVDAAGNASIRTDRNASTRLAEKLPAIEAQMDSLLDVEVGGYSYAVYKDGVEVTSGHAGMECQASLAPVSEKTQFAYGSITKMFIGALCSRAESSGLINYDDEIQTHLTDFPDNNITIRNLLQHRSGLDDVFNSTPFAAYGGAMMRVNRSPVEYLDLVKDMALVATPGDEWDYNNYNYTVLANLLEAKYWTNIQSISDTLLFSPVGVSGITFKEDLAVLPNQAASYWQGQESYQIHTTNAVGSGNAFGTITELAKWLSLIGSLDTSIQDGFTIGGELTENSERYTNGCRRGSRNQRPIYGHSGAFRGFLSQAYFDPISKVGVAVATSQGATTYGNIPDAAEYLWDTILDDVLMSPKS